MRAFVIVLALTAVTAGLAFAAAEAATAEAPPACPTCGSAADVVPIVYGLPGEELMAAAKRGEVALGGCLVSPDDPRWRCKKCGVDFR